MQKENKRLLESTVHRFFSAEMQGKYIMIPMKLKVKYLAIKVLWEVIKKIDNFLN